ncbi:MAG: amino acid ABC transporter substrate-binding protein, partial [Mesorhizobium sp.]
MLSVQTFRSIFVSGFMLAAAAGAARAEEGVLRVGTEGDAPLFSM